MAAPGSPPARARRIPRRMDGRAAERFLARAPISTGWSPIRRMSRPARPPRWRWRRSTPRCPETIGGSADLTGSNNTKTKAQKPLTHRRLFRPLHLLRHPRVRHGGGDERHGAARRRDPLWRHLPGLLRLLPRPAIRLSALQQARVIYVMTHDSIGLGEDGPTHQPIEHLQSLRAIPNLDVYPPRRRGRDGGMLGAGAGERTGRACSR